MSLNIEQLADEVLSQRIPNTRAKYPFATLKPGETFIVECSPEDRHSTQRKLCMAKWWYEKRLKTKYRTRVVEGGVRVERVS